MAAISDIAREMGLEAHDINVEGKEENVGQINIKAWGSMSPNADGSERVVDINHDGTNDEAFEKAHAALDEIKSDLKTKLGDSY